MLCGDHTETANHLLFQCRVAREAGIAWILYGTGGKSILKRVSFWRTTDLSIRKQKQWLSQRQSLTLQDFAIKGSLFIGKTKYLTCLYFSAEIPKHDDDGTKQNRDDDGTKQNREMVLTINLVNQKSRRRVHTSLQEFCMHFITVPKARFDSKRPTNASDRAQMTCPLLAPSSYLMSLSFSLIPLRC